MKQPIAAPATTPGLTPSEELGSCDVVDDVVLGAAVMVAVELAAEVGLGTKVELAAEVGLGTKVELAARAELDAVSELDGVSELETVAMVTK